MKNIIQLSLVAIISLICTSSFAGNVGALTEFFPNTPAVASEVNGNFTAVQTAVDTNFGLLTTVEGQAAANETAIAGQGTRLTAVEGVAAVNSTALSGQDARLTAVEAVAGANTTAVNNNAIDIANNAADIAILQATTGANLQPIAYGIVQSDGTFIDGTPNITTNFNASLGRYEISIQGESYHFAQYVTIVTCPSSSAVFATTNSVGGNLLVFLHDRTSSNIQGIFSFVTYRI